MKNARLPKVANPPERIFLCVGDIEEDCDFSDLFEVTWCQDDIDDGIEYRLVKRQRRIGRAKSMKTEGPTNVR